MSERDQDAAPLPVVGEGAREIGEPKTIGNHTKAWWLSWAKQHYDSRPGGNLHTLISAAFASTQAAAELELVKGERDEAVSERHEMYTTMTLATEESVSLRAENEKLLFTSDKQTVAWKERALAAEAEIASLKSAAAERDASVSGLLRAWVLVNVADLKMRPEDGGPQYVAKLNLPGKDEIQHIAIQPEQISRVFDAIFRRLGGWPEIEAWRRREREEAAAEMRERAAKAADEAAIGHVERETAQETVCAYCDASWPCDTARLPALIRALPLTGTTEPNPLVERAAKLEEALREWADATTEQCPPCDMEVGGCACSCVAIQDRTAQAEDVLRHLVHAALTPAGKAGTP